MTFKQSWLEEMRSAYMYRRIAEFELEPRKKKMFLQLSEFAQKQATIWHEKIKSLSKEELKPFSPGLRCRMILLLVRAFGTRRLRFILSTMKIRGMSAYTMPMHEEHQHVGFSFVNNLRAAVFGVNDGLISNLCLILGMVGAGVDQHTIIIGGISGVLAGAFSMGAGEYVSVRSQRDVYEYQIAIEREELQEYPKEEEQELSAIYQSRGLSKEDADQIAHLFIKNPETGLSTLAREELGLNPDDLVSPTGALISSFFSFLIGGVIPLIPFLFMAYSNNIVALSIAMTSASLFFVGAVLSLYTNQSAFWNGLRMLLIGCASGAGVFVAGYFVNFLL